VDVKDLKYFVAAFDARSFSGAAGALGTVHSNVSLRIRNLEEFLEVRLFRRLHRSVVPTPQGELLYRHAKHVIEAFEETAHAVKLDHAA
jgi:DNA-binding transcriptional LysR family regulator